MNAYEAIRNEVGGVLLCDFCGRTSELGDIETYCVFGWPRCCNTTMRWLFRNEMSLRDAYRTVAAKLIKQGGVVRCFICGGHQPVERIRSAWPSCCGGALMDHVSARDFKIEEDFLTEAEIEAGVI